MTQQYDITGRTARCTCGKTQPSSRDLAFFQYRGEGSRTAEHSCKNCGYDDTAHTDEVRARHHASNVCLTFERRGDFGFDSYFCGCSGWD